MQIAVSMRYFYLAFILQPFVFFFLLSSSFLSPSVKHMNNGINWKTKYSSRWWSDTWVVAWKQTGLLVIYWGHFILEAYRGPLYFSVCEWVQLCVCVCLSGSCYTTTHHCFYLIFILSLDLLPPRPPTLVGVCVCVCTTIVRAEIQTDGEREERDMSENMFTNILQQ